MASTLRATGISKGFPGVQALDGVDLELVGGQVTALMGENGAGKSTLLKILTGDYQPDAGQIEIDGDPVSFAAPHESRAAGLRVVAQEPEIVPYTSVAENLFLGRLPARNGLVDRRRLEAMAQDAIDRYGFTRMLPVRWLGHRLSPAQRQLIEILRCLVDEPRIICFDEPTSSLSDSETEHLFELIAQLRADGVAVGYVSHRLKEIFEIADRVTVLRDGQLVGSVEVPETTPDEVVRMMVGRDLSQMYQRTRSEVGEVALELRNVTTDDVTDVSLSVRQGEVVALAGLVGAGRTELAKAITGDLPIRSGELWVGGKVRRFADPQAAIAAGIGHAPEDRKGSALVMVRSVRENISLAVLDRLSKFGFVNRRAEWLLAGEHIDRLNVRTPGMDRSVANLSGGNQQKVVLARWLARDCEVLVLDEPTRGVDVGAKAEIYAIIDELAQQQVAVLLISSELPEVLGLADRIVVMESGRVTGELDAAEATEEAILALAMASDLEGASN